MMDGGMTSVMGWMTGIGPLGWVLVIALLATIVVVLLGLRARRHGRRDDPGSPGSSTSPLQAAVAVGFTIPFLPARILAIP